jgi:hypothetical protein
LEIIFKHFATNPLYNKLKIDFTRYAGKKAMTQGLQQLPTRQDITWRETACKTYEMVNNCIFLYVNNGGSVTESNSAQLSALDNAYAEYTNATKVFNSMVTHPENNINDYDPSFLYPRKTPLAIAQETLQTKEIIYQLYLLHSNAPTKWITVYCYLKNTINHPDVLRLITRYYYAITEIDRTIAWEVKNNFDQIDHEKRAHHESAKAGYKSIEDAVEMHRKETLLDCLDLDYFKKDQNGKEQYKKEARERLCYAAATLQ